MKLKIAVQGNIYEVEVEEVAEAALEHSALNLPAIQSTVLPTAAGGASSDFDEARVCRSPLAGVVSRIEVRPAQQVKQNQLLLVLDAMKMEIKVTAQAAATIKSLEVHPGDAVRPNQILVCFE